MAKVRQNIVMQGLSGSLGNQLILKTDKNGRTIVSVKPSFDEDRTFSLAQQVQQQAFREAVAYAREQTENELYLAKAEGTHLNAYNVAVADWFNRPEFREVDLTAWKGAPGDVIRVKVQDDVKVVEVSVKLSDEDGFTLEEGQATDLGALWWEYAPSGNLTGKLTLTISAKDLPGHVTEYTQVRTISAA